jgi:hypothetical protein
MSPYTRNQAQGLQSLGIGLYRIVFNHRIDYFLRKFSNCTLHLTERMRSEGRKDEDDTATRRRQIGRFQLIEGEKAGLNNLNVP